MGRDLKTTLDEMGTRIRRLRLQRGLTLRSLGATSGVGAKRLCEIENGRANATVETLLKVANALDVDLSQFFTSEAPESYTYYVTNPEHPADPFDYDDGDEDNEDMYGLRKYPWH